MGRKSFKNVLMSGPNSSSSSLYVGFFPLFALKLTTSGSFGVSASILDLSSSSSSLELRSLGSSLDSDSSLLSSSEFKSLASVDSAGALEALPVDSDLPEIESSELFSGETFVRLRRWASCGVAGDAMAVVAARRCAKCTTGCTVVLRWWWFPNCLGLWWKRWQDSSNYLGEAGELGRGGLRCEPEL